MSTLLQINSSLFGDGSQSTRLADRYVAAWRATHPDAELIVRDVARDPLPHLGGVEFAALATKPESRTPAQRAAAALSDTLVAELTRADVLVIALPMYNFGVPSQLKAWFDRIARAGVTFRYTENGPVGLMTGKRAIVFATRGGRYAGTAQDVQTPFVRQFLAFLGIKDVEFVYAEGLALGDAPKAESLAAAQAKADALATVEPQRLAA